MFKESAAKHKRNTLNRDSYCQKNKATIHKEWRKPKARRKSNEKDYRK